MSECRSLSPVPLWFVTSATLDSYDQHLVPQLGESVVEARVARWLKKEGDRVEIGEPVVELETEKIDLEVGADTAA